MAQFHSLEVSDVRKETDNCVSIGLIVPDNLKNTFSYKHGQYLTLNVSVNGEELRRSYSLCSAPHEDGLRIAVKQVKGGRVSTELVRNLRKGNSLEVMEPMGGFTSDIDPTATTTYVLFAAGSGITPILSILKTVLKEEPGSNVILFYGNTDATSIIFKQELMEIKEVYGERLMVHHVLSRETGSDPMFNGRIGEEKAGQLLDRFVQVQESAEYFICGPYDMMMNIKSALTSRKVAEDHIHIELFSTPVEAETDEAPAPQDGDFDGVAKVKVIIDGDEEEMEIATNGDSILDSALDAGMDAPFACKGAVCCTCKAKVVEGTVRMDMNYALTDGEVEDGYVLTCQSHPTSARVVVDFDQP